MRGAYPPRQRAGIQAAAMVVEGAARTWERRRIRRRLLENRSLCVPTTPARRPAEILQPSDTQELAPSRSGATLRRRQIEPNPESMCNPDQGGGCDMKIDKLRATKERRRQAGSETRTPAPTPRALHLSWIRPVAPECGKRGSRGRYKGWAARMSTVRGARGEGARSRSPGAGRRRPAPPSPHPPPGEARAQAPPPRGAGLGHLDAASVPGGGAKTQVRVPETLREPASGMSGRMWDSGGTHACGCAG